MAEPLPVNTRGLPRRLRWLVLPFAASVVLHGIAWQVAARLVAGAAPAGSADDSRAIAVDLLAPPLAASPAAPPVASPAAPAPHPARALPARRVSVAPATRRALPPPAPPLADAAPSADATGEAPSAPSEAPPMSASPDAGSVATSPETPPGAAEAASSGPGSGITAAAASTDPARPRESGSASAAVRLPARAHLVYDTTGTIRFAGISLTMHGTTTTDWQYAAGRFESNLVNETAEFGQSSSGIVRATAGLAPEHYTEKRRHRAALVTNIDWTTRQVTFSQTPDVLRAPDGVQDRLSVQFQMAVLRQAYPERFEPGTQFPMTVVGTHDFSEWTITVCCEEPLPTAHGRVMATRVRTSRIEDGAPETMDMWLSPDLSWFPARVRLVDHNGNIIDSMLQSAQVDDGPAAEGAAGPR